jgi:hypothetical protein
VPGEVLTFKLGDDGAINSSTYRCDLAKRCSLATEGLKRSRPGESIPPLEVSWPMGQIISRAAADPGAEVCLWQVSLELACCPGISLLRGRLALELRTELLQPGFEFG